MTKFSKRVENMVGKGEIARYEPKQALDFTYLQYKPFENTVEKEKFLLFPHCFLPVWRTFCHLYQI